VRGGASGADRTLLNSGAVMMLLVITSLLARLRPQTSTVVLVVRRGEAQPGVDQAHRVPVRVGVVELGEENTRSCQFTSARALSLPAEPIGNVVVGHRRGTRVPARSTGGCPPTLTCWKPCR